MNKKRNSTATLRLACAIIFIVFTYLYLNCYQADILAVAQHELSDGLTSYSYTISPILTTLVLFLLQLGVYTVTGVKKMFHALTYLPSLLVLTFITDVSCHVDTYRSIGAWAWIFPLVLLLFAGAMWVIRQLEPYETEAHTGIWLSRRMWVNMLQMVVMFLLVVCISNGNQVFHHRMKMERLMMERKYADALEVGKLTEETDSSLTMLRAACLHRTGQMGDKLFTYPLIGGSKVLIPDSVTTKALMWQTPRWMHPMKNGKLRYIKPTDYLLCGFLMDKKLDQFVAEVQKKYSLNDSVALPKHYQEALILYTHHRAHPKVVYRNTVMEADFQDFQALECKYANPVQRNSALRDTYGNTYWYYYQYGQK